MENAVPEHAMYKPFFDLVAPKANWKYPIDATVTAPRGAGDFTLWCSMVERAIGYFVGGGAKIEVLKVEDLGWRTVRVTAPGYYKLIGA